MGGWVAASQAAATRAWAAARAAWTSHGYNGNGAAQREPDQGADTGTVGRELSVGISRTRPCDKVEGSPEREPGPRVGRGGASAEADTGPETGTGPGGPQHGLGHR